MTDTIATYGATKVFVVSSDGPPIGTEQSALDLIGASYGQDVDIIAVPVARLGDDFLKLQTGIAGAFIQKFMNYGYRVAIVGDISAAIAGSKSLHDFVYESNKGKQVTFVPDLDALVARL
jgi:uncharacterized Zn-binding protein involved in type VI secretion